MQDKDAFRDMKRAKEEEYFRKREQELIENMKRRAREEAARKELAQASGIADEEALHKLQELGYTKDTVSLLHLAPLVYVAWAEGGVSKRERDLIFEVAALHGIAEGSPAHQRLTQWLDRRPSEDFFEKTFRVIGHLLESLTPEEREISKKDLVSYSTRIAAASGGLLGIGPKISDEEREALERITEVLEKEKHEAVRKVVEST